MLWYGIVWYVCVYAYVYVQYIQYVYIYIYIYVFMYLCVCVFSHLCINAHQNVWKCMNMIEFVQRMYIIIYIYIHSLGNSRFTKRTWTILGRSHHLPHVCTKMMYSMFWGVSLKGKWCRRHKLRRGHCYLGRSHRLPHVCRISFLPVSGSSIYTFSYMIVPQKVISWLLKKLNLISYSYIMLYLQ